MKNIVIIGAGDLGKEVVWLIDEINKVKPTYVILGFLDDDVLKEMDSFYGYRVLGRTNKLEDLYEENYFSAVIAIQDGNIRRKIVEEHKDFDNWETIIHPSAVISQSVAIGKGCIAFPYVTISVDTKLGDFSLCYIRSTICNDCILGDYLSVMTGASILEHVKVGDGCYLSSGSCVYPHKTLGKNVKVAVDTIVTCDYSDNADVGNKDVGFMLFK